MTAKLAPLLCCLLLATTGCDSSPAIGVVDMQQLVLTSVPGRKAQDYVVQLGKIYQQDLDILQQKLASYPDREQARRIALDARARYQAELDARKEQVAQRLSTEIRKTISTYQQERQFALIANTETLLEYDASLDITPAILTAFNAAGFALPPLPVVENNPVLPSPATPEVQLGAQPQTPPAQPDKRSDRSVKPGSSRR